VRARLGGQGTGLWTREENRTKSYYLGNKKTIVRRKSSLSTFPPCLPSPALTDNIKNLPLSATPLSPLAILYNRVQNGW
jgi:hypothetical protein